MRPSWARVWAARGHRRDRRWRSSATCSGRAFLFAHRMYGGGAYDPANERVLWQTPLVMAAHRHRHDGLDRPAHRCSSAGRSSCRRPTPYPRRELLHPRRVPRAGSGPRSPPAARSSAAGPAPASPPSAPRPAASTSSSSTTPAASAWPAAARLAGMMPYGDANQIVMDMAREVLPVVEKTPVLAGVCGTDPFRIMKLFLRDVQDAGLQRGAELPHRRPDRRHLPRRTSKRRTWASTRKSR